MAYIVRADIVDGDLNVVSCHEFYGDTARDAQGELEDFMEACGAMKQADSEDRLIISDAEEISDDELPEVQEDEEQEAIDIEPS